MLTIENTIQSLSNYCKQTTGDSQTWQGNKATYSWNVGKYSVDGTLNGVVRKLAVIDPTGNQIWVVAGSFKIAPDGTILRFTGMPKKTQLLIVAHTPALVEA
jgi:hypothetical protein